MKDLGIDVLRDLLQGQNILPFKTERLSLFSKDESLCLQTLRIDASLSIRLKANTLC